MSQLRRLATVVLLVALAPSPGGSQLVFRWPIRTSPRPEAVLDGAQAVFWNPGALAAGIASGREVWIVHVDGPDVTGVRGVAAAGVADLPLGVRAGVGYWHLGIQDIPRTTDSPETDPGELSVAEDVAVVSGARVIARNLGVGGALRFARSTVGALDRSRVEGELGLHLQTRHPWRPSLGIMVSGLGGTVSGLAGAEVSTPALASGRLPIQFGYGVKTGSKWEPAAHRLAIRGSWMEQIHGGVGLSYLGSRNGWVRLWMLGIDVGRYSLGIMREGLANGFGAIHFYRAAIRFP